jgi:hypothetical protein
LAVYELFGLFLVNSNRLIRANQFNSNRHF